MRKEISTIGVFSMVVSFAAAVMLCTQTAHVTFHPEWKFSNPTLIAMEAGLFGIAVLIWRRSVSLTGWVVGIVALLLVRSALTHACAYGAAGMQTGAGYTRALTVMNQFVPRLSAVFFSLIVFYPLRSLLPERVGLRLRKQRTKPTSSGGISVENNSVWLMRGEEKVRVQREDKQASPSVTPTNVVTIASPDQITGSIELPLRVLLANVPPEYITKEFQQYGDNFRVSVPLSLLLPQLKEAQIILDFDQLQKLLPTGVVKVPKVHGLEGESMLVLLALEEVIPLLPDEVFELPPPSPPAWAELPDPESVVFATL